MENSNVTMANFNGAEVGAVNPAPTTETPVNDGYMSSQGYSESVQEVQTEDAKPYTLRKLNSTDLFPMIRLISKIGLDELTTVFEGDSLKELVNSIKARNEGASKVDLQTVAGLNLALKMVNKILEHLPTCEREIYTLLSNVSGMSIDDLKGLDLDVFMEMLLDFVTKEEFKGFFKVASKYIKK